MGSDTTSASTDLVRWSFTIDPARRGEIETHLVDLGADLLVRDGQDFVVIWDEPDGDLTEVIEAIWALNGAPFDVVVEPFHRLDLITIQFAEEEASAEAA